MRQSLPAARHHRRRVRLLLASLILIAACAGSSDESVTDDRTAATTTSTVAAPTTTQAEPAASTVPTAPTTTAIGDPLPSLAELEQLVFDGEISELDVALTAFSAVTGVELDGALAVARDDSIPDELTSVVSRLRLLDDQLTDGQRQQVADYLEGVRSSARLISDETFEATGSVDESAGGRESGEADATADARISALVAPRPRLSTLTDAQFNALVVKARRYVMEHVGGEMPRYDFYVVDEDDRTTEQSTWAGWASTNENPDGSRVCSLYVVDFPGTSIARFEAVLTHEFFHCWHGANFPGAVDGYWDTPAWIVEGLAEWVESEASDGANGTGWANTFLNAPTGRLYVSSYHAVAFYWQLNYLDGGPDGLWRRIPSIIQNGRSPGAFRAATAGLEPRQIAQLASMSTQFSQRGFPWTFTAPRLGSGARTITPRPVRGTAYEFVKPGQQAAFAFDFAPGGDEPMLIEIVHQGLTISAWADDPNSVFTPSSKTTWCLNPECVCEDGRIPDSTARPIPGNAGQMMIALTGGAEEEASVEATVRTLEDACTEETDPELTGVWIAEASAMVEAYDLAYEQIGISVTGASGELALSLLDDGTAELRYQEVRLALSDPFVDKVIVNGAGKLDWFVEDGQLVFSGLADLTISILTPSISNDPITFTGADLPSIEGQTTMDYVRTGASLAMSNIVGSLATLDDGSPGVLVFPTRWVRGGDVAS